MWKLILAILIYDELFRNNKDKKKKVIKIKPLKGDAYYETKKARARERYYLGTS